MPPSTPNSTGSTSPSAIPYGRWDSFPRQPFPIYEGTKAIIYRSADGKMAIGTLHEKGKDTLTWPVDEFLFVTEGWITMDVEGGEKFTLRKGDVMVMRKGQVITFEASEDFANVAVFWDEGGRVELV
ncbi:hypothetical protein FQN52_008798 [Onygenales sp. PD_12]|nr:hypothetical protein FQN52_008798 [Onygenales sp. PD_12]